MGGRLLLLANSCLLLLVYADADPIGICPNTNAGQAIHLPHESNCTLFYQCDWGKLVLKECPSNLHFNPELEVCDWPEAAGCEAGSNGGDGENGGNSEDNESGAVDAENSGENGGNSEENGSDGGAVGECPPDNNGNAVHLPHESDCGLFYKCDWGVPVLQQCPSGLHFNPNLQVCDWPDAAGCDGNNNGSEENGESSEEDGTSGVDGGDSGEDGGNSEGNGGDGGAVGECPLDNNGNAVHLPHESDCGLFYKCDWGVPVLQECPSGLHFNPSLQVCDWPDAAGCGGNNNGSEENDESSEEDGTSGVDGGDSGEDGENSEGNGGDGGAVGECPPDNNGNAVHLPHESDCGLFYKCDWGVPVLQECPSGLHFNPSLQVCDWPDAAGCGGNNNGSEENGESSEEDDTSGVDGGDSGEDGENSEGNGGDGGAVGECPPDNNGNAVHLPHESDCGLFYKCDWGVPVLQECPSGLHFNPSLQVCDWSDAAGCGGNNNGSEENDESSEEDGTSGVDGGDSGEDGENSEGNGGDGGAVGECPSDNNGNAVHLPHESDCGLFYKCDWGVPVLQECPSGLHFNPSLQVCDWPDAAGCGGNNNGSEENGESSEEDGTSGVDGGDSGEDGENSEGNGGDGGAVGECPPDNNGNAVHLPHESDCGLFYKCDWGVPVLQECPSGLHFNPSLQVCDWPDAAGCGGNNNGSEENGESSEEDGTSGVDGGDSGEDGENSEGNGGDGGAVGECPPDNNGNAVHLPHESDCGLFYKCDWGVPVLQECPSGLHFNPSLQVCDWPDAAGCGGNNNGSEENGESSEEDGTSGVDGGDSGEDGENSEGNGGDGGAVGECPPDNNGNAVHLPHESDCGLFYKCDWGVPVLQECPSGLHFNPSLQVCDWPDAAGCGGNNNGSEENGESSEEDGTSGVDGGDSGEDGGNSEGNGGDGGAVGECPPDNNGNAVHLPHESDCGLFYKCDWGVPVLQECPSGLHFNPSLQVCDWPDAAGCGGNNNGSEENGESSEEDGTSGVDGGDSGEDGENSEGNGGDGGAVGECPSDNNGNAVHLPHESDCGLFYKCDWGVPVLQECPSGLHFNPSLQVCDWPDAAGCGGNNNGSEENGESSEEDGTSGVDGGDSGEDGGNSEGNGGDGGAVGECPPDNNGNAVHLPHESDCGLFYKCDWGVPVLQECPSGLHFNPSLQVCDWPDAAGCGGNNNGSEENGESSEGDGTSGVDGGDSGEDGGNSEENGSDGGAVGVCPPDNNGNAVHLPHESDCGLFYKCDWGVPVLQECLSGLHFNPSLQVCDWPETAGCDGNNSRKENDCDGSQDWECVLQR